MPALLIPVQPNLADRPANGPAPLVRLSKSGQSGWSLSAIVACVLRGLIIAAVVVAGMALVVSILVPALFITAVLLLVVLSPFLLVAVGIVLTEDMESVRGTRTAATACRCGGMR